jgi:DNA repair ATPase RecN
MQILLEPRHVEMLHALKKERGLAASAAIRDALDHYNPDSAEQEEALQRMTKALRAANEQAGTTLKTAEREIQETLAYFRESRED